MKNPLLFVIFILLGTCFCWGQGLSKEPTRIPLNYADLKLIVDDIDPSGFHTEVNGNSAVIDTRGYEGIDGKRIRIVGKGLRELKVAIRFEFGILQYLIDDDPASPLDFSYETDFTEIAVINNAIQIPQFYNNYENVVNVYQHLRYSDRETFERFIEDRFFQRIKALSYKKQKIFYERLLSEDRKRYEKCCPEYIKQANEFLTKNTADFKSFNDLGIEIYCSKLFLDFSGINQQGKKVKYTLIGQ